jgi:predicted phosphodiesterase
MLLILLASQVLLSCKKDYFNDDHVPGKGDGINKSRLKIAIVSDIHYMDPSLLVNGGAEGTAFQNYIAQDPKLVQYSDPIFRTVLHQLKMERPDILLVPGDITKDGEKISHQAVARFLDKLSQEGVKVYAMPGNHDINNAKAKKYDGDNDYPVEMTTAADFASIYGKFGYKHAISRDPNSLSYVAQVQPNLRIIAIDASKYEEYGPSGDVADGRIKPETLTWILDQLAQAKQKNITVFAMMHHNLIEHYVGQSQLDPGYVIDDWQNVANTLIEAGLEIIFTGHYHANDISSYTYNGKKLFDIQTGSLVTAPIPYRIVNLEKNTLSISSRHVESIPASLPGGVDFVSYSNSFLSQHLDAYFNYYLTNRLGAPADLAAFASPLFRMASWLISPGTRTCRPTSASRSITSPPYPNNWQTLLLPYGPTRQKQIIQMLISY